MAKVRFDWDQDKDDKNHKKHGVTFAVAQLAFAEPKRVIAEDLGHRSGEQRFTYRGDVIRIHGAGYWRKGKRIYERENQVHR